MLDKKQIAKTLTNLKLCNTVNVDGEQFRLTYINTSAVSDLEPVIGMLQTGSEEEAQVHLKSLKEANISDEGHLIIGGSTYVFMKLMPINVENAMSKAELELKDNISKLDNALDIAMSHFQKCPFENSYIISEINEALNQ